MIVPCKLTIIVMINIKIWTVLLQTHTLCVWLKLNFLFYPIKHESTSTCHHMHNEFLAHQLELSSSSESEHVHCLDKSVTIHI